MKKICILMPTFGKQDCIDYHLKMKLAECENLGGGNIDFWICDSTKGNEIYNIVKKYQNQGYQNLFYMRESKEPENHEKSKTPDYKVYMAQLELAEKYDYIWLCGDNCILNFDIIIDDVIKYTDASIDIIHFNNYVNELPLGTTIMYNDAVQFYKKDAWHLTAYGASLVASKVIKLMNNKEVLEKYYDSGFLYVMSLFEYCASNQFRAVRCQRDFHKNNPYREASGWIVNGDAFKVFAKNWVDVNYRLPNIYDEVREEAIKNHSKYSGLFTYKNCIKLRANYHNITLAKVKKYQKAISLATNTNIAWFYLCAACPSMMMRWILKIYQKLKNK